MKTILSALLCSVVLAANAQAPGSQSERLKEFPTGEYTAYSTYKDPSTGKYTIEVSGLVFQIVSVTPDGDQPEAHSHVRLIHNKSEANAAGKDSEGTLFTPDHVAYPVTYRSNVYMGNPQLIEQVGRVPGRGSSSTRLVFLDGLIYYITEWESADEYKLKAVLVPGGLPSGVIAKTKAEFKAFKMIRELDPEAKLKAYFAEAYSAQEAYYAKWKTDPANRAKETEIDARYEAMVEGIKNFNTDYENSDYYKRVVRNNAIADAVAAASMVTVKNNTSATVYIYTEGSSNGMSLSASNSRAYDCNTALYYTTNPTSSVNGNGTRFHGGGGCGSTVTVR